MKITSCTYGICRHRLHHRPVPTLTKGDQYRMSGRACASAHAAPLQPHPPLPCTYFPSPVVNCIPLDDITGNKSQQQDNKRSELQSTSFISDFITPRLMDVDLYTLLHLSCSIQQITSSSSSSPSVLSLLLSLTPFPSFCPFAVIYGPVTNTSPPPK